MKRIALLENPIQEYAWGSRTAIAALRGEPPAPRPQAELWMGAHPRAPSHVRVEGRRVSLLECIERAPREVLGERVVERFGDRLPFLLKLLAAEKPLSIQAHPDAEQARRGFADEEARGLARDARERRYPDPNPKPELICALAPFVALRGFRPVAEVEARLERLGARGLARARERLAAEGLRGLLSELLGMRGAAREALVAEAAAAAAARAADDPAFVWIARLAREHPGDVGALAPAFLHLVELAPGEAMFLSAGELHSYLEGVGVELMGNSDNVLRGGLTEKHVDADELLRVLRFEASRPERLRPEPAGPREEVYAAPAAEFRLSRLRLARGQAFAAPADRGIEILLCLDGAPRIATPGDAHELPLAPGASAVAPAAAGAYWVEGPGTLYRASVPV